MRWSGRPDCRGRARGRGLLPQSPAQSTCCGGTRHRRARMAGRHTSEQSTLDDGKRCRHQQLDQISLDRAPCAASHRTSAQAVINGLAAAARAIDANNAAALSAALPRRVFPLGPQQTVARLSQPPSLPDVMQAYWALARGPSPGGGASAEGAIVGPELRCRVIGTRSRERGGLGTRNSVRPCAATDTSRLQTACCCGSTRRWDRRSGR